MANPFTYKRADGIFVFTNPYDKHALVELAQCLEDWEDAKIIACACECSVYMLEYDSSTYTLNALNSLSCNVIREFHPN